MTQRAKEAAGDLLKRRGVNKNELLSYIEEYLTTRDNPENFRGYDIVDRLHILDRNRGWNKATFDAARQFINKRNVWSRHRGTGTMSFEEAWDNMRNWTDWRGNSIDRDGTRAYAEYVLIADRQEDWVTDEKHHSNPMNNKIYHASRHFPPFQAKIEEAAAEALGISEHQLPENFDVFEDLVTRLEKYYENRGIGTRQTLIENARLILEFGHVPTFAEQRARREAADE